MSLLVLHVALTPLAGGPIRIVNALNQHTNVHARLVIFDPGAYGSRRFAGDLDWKTDNGEARDLFCKADIVHLHHYFALKNNPFEFNFREDCNRKAQFIRQFHSTPTTIARGDATLAQNIVHSKLPQLVIAQYPERLFPKARAVPNIVPLNDDLYVPSTNRRVENPNIFFSPSRDDPAWSVQLGQTRWDTKGSYETEHLLKTIVKDCEKGRLIVRRGIPHEQCLRERQASDIAIDEMVTGSFHLTSLESLSQGLPTFAFLDARTLDTLATLTGTRSQPWLNFRLEESEGPLIELIKDVELRRETGDFARKWMEKYYNDREMIKHYVRVYEDLLERPESFKTPRFDISSRRQVFMAQRCDDLVWEKRKQRIEAESMFSHLTPNKPESRPEIIGAMPNWIKAPVHNLLKKYTSVRVDEIQALEKRLAAAERLLKFVTADDTNRWLYHNRLERMDATLDVFDEKRREFHLDRYRFAAQRVKGKRVLDCACGTGYGVRALRESGDARFVIGVDIEEKAIEYAFQKHRIDSTSFLCSSGDCLALSGASVDVITSFETIEHVPDDVALLKEFHRVLRPNGVLIISTPNQWPLAAAPFHVREYDRKSFVDVLEAEFDCLEIYNQNSGSESPYNRGQTARIVPTTPQNEEYAECYLAICRSK